MTTILLVTSLTVTGAPPAWWTQVGADGHPVIDPTITDPNPNGPANIGQAKFMAKRALEALAAAVGGGTSGQAPIVEAIELELYKPEENSPQGVFYPVRPAQPTAQWLDSQKVPLQIGALKALAAPFYRHLGARNADWVKDQLTANGLTLGTSFFQDTDGTYYPWNPADNTNSEKNRAPATIGQLKAVFSLRFESLPAEFIDLDWDGMDDAWELANGLDPANGFDTYEDPDEDGLTNLQEFNLGTNPWLSDTDRDGMKDGFEYENGYDPNNGDENNNGIPDGEDDSDGDGSSNAAEAEAGSNPNDVNNKPGDASWHTVTGNKPQEEPKKETKTFTIKKGESRLVVVGITSQEYPEFTGDSSEWDDILEWKITPSTGDAINGIVHVNDLHEEWEIDEALGVTLNAFGPTPPVHIEKIKMIQAPLNADLTVKIELTATNISDERLPSTVIVGLLPVGIQAHRRGTLNGPGAVVPHGTGEYGYETVMMENGDSESSAVSTSRDCIESGASAGLSEYRKANDDDLVKIVLRWPVGIKPEGTSLKLLHDGMLVDATQKTPAEAVSINGPSRLNFYKKDGSRLNPQVDLQIADLSNPPTDNYLAKVLTEGEVTIFIEGADSFGDFPSSQTRLGGALLRLEFTTGTDKAIQKLLVYRGGFLRFLQPRGAPGSVGAFEFWDGKGRVRHTYGGFGNEFKTDDTDMGTRLASWSAKSGKTTGDAYNVPDENGHTPPGWWRQYRSTKEWKESQVDQPSGSGATRKIKQGAYVRWMQDDETSDERRNTIPYNYDASFAKDLSLGEPKGIKFKFDMDPIEPSKYQNRSAIQIHPDGKCNGTAGCIGIQTYKDCEEVNDTLNNYHGLKVKVQLTP